jgi:YHS domain-containing protein
MAHQRTLLPVLVGLGIENLSMPFRLIPRLANLAQSLDIASCRRLAADCLNASGADEVRRLLAEWHGEELPLPSPSGSRHTDPICGMAVEPDSTPFWIETNDRTAYFCSLICLEQYRNRGHERKTGDNQ